MKKKIKINKTIIFCLFIFYLISILSISSTLNYLPETLNNLVIKQTIFYILGIVLILIIINIDSNILINKSKYIYLLNVFLLLLVLIIGEKTNGIKAWFYIPVFGSFQPSEFMKISLILFLAEIINKNRKSEQCDFNLIIKCLIITLIPSILTFLEPDTGAVIVYFVILIVMLFVSGINLKWFIYFIFLGILGIGSILYLYLYKQDLFISIFGSSLFYRLDRLFDFVNLNGMQLTNSIISISSSGIFGHGINNIPIYFPELQTDFIFASFTSCFGLFGSIILILTIFIFDKEIINIGKNKKENIYKYILSGICAVLIYQQIQNISMTIGLLPITGITLPFISYGGSSLISFMILIGIVLNIQKNK